MQWLLHMAIVVFLLPDDAVDFVVCDPYEDERVNELPSDVMNPFVVMGAGCPNGFSHFEHVAWAMNVSHPFQAPETRLDEDLNIAIRFECDHEAGVIDGFRQSQLECWARRAEVLCDRQREGSNQYHPKLLKLVQRLHGPLVEELMAATGFRDELLVHDLQCGFPFVGDLPVVGEAAKDEIPRRKGFESIHDLQVPRHERILVALAQLKETEWTEDFLSSCQEDFVLGALGPVQVLQEHDLHAVTLSRRLPVREERARGWRTWVVDHSTESGISYATFPANKLVNDSLDLLVSLLLIFLRAGIEPFVMEA